MLSFKEMSNPSHQKLLSILRSEGPLSPADLMRRLELSQPTLFRSAKAQEEAIIALGGGRNRRLAAPRNVRGLGPSTPVFMISTEGEIILIGKLLALYPTSFVFIQETTPSKPEFYPGIPFYLDDMRPQGFIGRAFALKHADLKLPQRISDWNNDDILESMARRGEDLTGNLLIGAASFERHQAALSAQHEIIKRSNVEEYYVKYAQAAIDGQPPGSSAGGEHPKFSAITSSDDGTINRVLVKFSPQGDTFSARRWRDLLICEALSLEVLRHHGINAAECRIVEAGGRTFLETLRFDRKGLNGRKGTLALAALENEWTGRGENWAVSAEFLARQKKISAEDLVTIQKLECFGRLIANSDRHSGNLSFYWQRGEPRALLAPVYDMLPMLYAPSSGGEDTRRSFTLPSYDHTLLEAWKDALSMATHYWERVRADSRLSAEFIQIAGRNLDVIRAPTELNPVPGP